jgi:sterol desaturase/sphingolipid hydroxylase (fatty acid hydroxylase superfamily)
MEDIAALLRQDTQRAAVLSRAPLPGLALFQRVFVPSLLGISLLSWMFHGDLDRWLTAAHLPLDAMTVVLFASLFGVWIAEQLYPAHPEWNYNLRADSLRGLARFGRDMVYLLVMTQVTAVLIKLTADQLVPALQRQGYGLGAMGTIWPREAPFAVRVVLVFLLTELASYGLHWTSHHVGFFWRFHSTHHMPAELSGLKSLRLHPVDNVCAYLVRTVPLLLLGAGTEEVLTITYFACTLSILSHANVSVADGPLGLLVNLPQYHQIHHSSDIEESRSNYGCHTVLFDRLFGTFRRTPKGPLVLGTFPLGARTLWQELVWPFYRAVSSSPP